VSVDLPVSVYFPVSVYLPVSVDLAMPSVFHIGHQYRMHRTLILIRHKLPLTVKLYRLSSGNYYQPDCHRGWVFATETHRISPRLALEARCPVVTNSHSEIPATPPIIADVRLLLVLLPVGLRIKNVISSSRASDSMRTTGHSPDSQQSRDGHVSKQRWRVNAISKSTTLTFGF
jgi:hypothetical protein